MGRHRGHSLVGTGSAAHFRPDVEGLRAVAVLAVLAFHARVPGIAGGFVGVDVFYVISGYLITGCCSGSSGVRQRRPARFLRAARGDVCCRLRWR